jgi:hypothetical protein
MLSAIVVNLYYDTVLVLLLTAGEARRDREGKDANNILTYCGSYSSLGRPLL